MNQQLSGIPNEALDGAHVFYDGRFQETIDRASAPVLSPATNAPIAAMALAGQADVGRAVSAAAAAFGSWSATDALDRGRHLRNLANLVRDRMSDLARWETPPLPLLFEALSSPAAPLKLSVLDVGDIWRSVMTSALACVDAASSHGGWPD